MQGRNKKRRSAYVTWNNEIFVQLLTDKVKWITKQHTQEQEKFTSTLDKPTQKSYFQQEKLHTKS